MKDQTKQLKDDTHMTSMKIVLFSRPPAPLVHLHQTFFYPIKLWRPIPNETPPLQMINNQLKENIIQGWLLYVTRSFFQVSFCFQYHSLIFSGFPLTSFHLAEASLSAFLWLYTLVCAVLQKYREMLFIYNYSHF